MVSLGTVLVLCAVDSIMALEHLLRFGGFSKRGMVEKNERGRQPQNPGFPALERWTSWTIVSAGVSFPRVRSDVGKGERLTHAPWD